MLVMFSCFQHSNVEPWRGERAPVLAGSTLRRDARGRGLGEGLVSSRRALAASLHSHALCAADRMASSPSGW